MCGIAGIHRRGNAEVPKLRELSRELLLAIESRGRDATGLMAMHDNGKVQWIRQARPAGVFSKEFPAVNAQARNVLLHTRFATTGTLAWQNAHPIANGHMAAVHNGTIYNADELFKAFGLRRYAQVDSEIIPALVNEMGWEHAKEAFDLMDGGAATAVINCKAPGELILARTEGYPLVYMVRKDVIVFASTEEAIRRAWHKTYGRELAAPLFHRLPEWTMVRVNGKIETQVIKVVKPKPKWLSEPSPWKVPKKTKGKGKGKGKRKAKAKSQQLSIATTDTTREVVDKLQAAVDEMLAAARPAVPALFEREPWMEEVVHDLMRVEGYDRTEAEEIVYGTSWEA